jgi:AraC-like DNA-binding protein
MSEIFETKSVDLAEHMLSSTYNTVRISAQGQRQGFRMTRTAVGPVRLDRIRFGMSFDARSEPLGVLAIAKLIAGRNRRESGGGERRYLPGDVYLSSQPEHPLMARIEDAEVSVAVIDPALPGQVAEGEPGQIRRPVRFTGYEPVSPEAARLWRVTYAYVRDAVLALPGDPGQSLVAGNAARLLAATALAVFPNNALTDPTIEDRHDAHPATVRRAVAFIDDNAHRDITIADIAAASFVTTRAVQLAFQRHLGTTPTGYLRRARLARAHSDLARATPHDGLTVTAVAYRWGFHSSSQFAAAYRRAYGVSPSRTLHQD